MYVNVFGLNFAYWYQDIFINLQLKKIKDSANRLWYQARNYDLFGRLEKAEPIYRKILNNQNKNVFYERAVFFLGQLLIRKKKYLEAEELIRNFLIKNPDSQWAPYFSFYLASCYENLGEMQKAIETYKQVKDGKLYADAMMHIEQSAH